MLLKHNLTLYRVLKTTWKTDLLIILLCTISYLLDRTVFWNVQFAAFMPSLLGIAVAFFIAFSNNQAYNRWWEARTIWGGLVNDSRSLCRSILSYVDDDNEGGPSDLQRKMILRHIGFLYALKDSLRSVNSGAFKKFLSEDESSHVEQFMNIPNAILDLQAADLSMLFRSGHIDGFRFRSLDELVVKLCTQMGQSERIKNTVFPPGYVYFTRLFIWIFVMLTTMALTENIGARAIFFGWIIGFVFHATHITGMTLMNPFELQPPSIPLDSIVRNIEINLLQALGNTETPQPVQPSLDGEYIL